MNVFYNWEQYYHVMRDRYSGNNMDDNNIDEHYQQLLQMGFDPQEGLYRFIKSTYVGEYAYEVMGEFENIIVTFLSHGAKINKDILDLLFNRENPSWDLVDELKTSYQIRGYIIDIIANIYHMDKSILSNDLLIIGKRLYKQLSTHDNGPYTFVPLDLIVNLYSD